MALALDAAGCALLPFPPDTVPVRPRASGAKREAGQPANRCVAEFVLHQDGGIDHWLAPGGGADERRTIALGLRNVIGSLRMGG